MAFENGFDPRIHFEPIINWLKKNPGAKEKIISLLELYEQNKNWEVIFNSIQNLIQDDWAYSCFRQFLIYDEEQAEKIWGKDEPKLKDIDMEPEYKEFFRHVYNIVKLG